jgi:murein DD-endopeptidase MepM/ murein hydrolase activator NlpD
MFEDLKNIYVRSVFIAFIFFITLVWFGLGKTNARHLSVNLRSANGGFVVAENGGGGIVNANRNEAHEWETFTIIDINGGELEDGDEINIRTINGNFFVAIDGGGGDLLANRAAPKEWELFKIIKVNTSSSRLVRDGDRILIKSSKGYYVTADGGGGGNVTAKSRAIDNQTRFALRVLGAPAHLKLSGPFTMPQAIIPFPMGVDSSGGSNPDPRCTNSFLGNNMPNCYSGHTGTDFGFAGHFAGMNLGSIEVVIAAPGRVVSIADGNFDRCYFRVPPPPPGASAEERIICPGVPDNRLDANFVVVLQDDGLLAYYYHLKRDSIAVKVGDRVECGQFIGKVGSSGISSGPHLHFELRKIEPCSSATAECFPKSPADFARMQGTVIDPYSPMLWARLVGRIPQKVCGNSSDASGSGDLGQPCGNFNSCRVGLVCQSGTCKRVAVPPGGTCDANQICGPGLQCSDGKCKVPTPNIPRPPRPF